MLLARRRFLSLFPAPFIVAAANIMPVKALVATAPLNEFTALSGEMTVSAEMFARLVNQRPALVNRFLVTAKQGLDLRNLGCHVA